MKDYENSCRCGTCDTFGPNGRDVWVSEGDCKIQLDIKADKHTSTIIWGYIYDNNNCLLKNVTVTLLRCVNGCNPESLCHTHTGACGYYQFEIPYGCIGKYKVVASRSSYTENKGTRDISCSSSCEERERYCGGKGSYNTEQNNICYY